MTLKNLIKKIGLLAIPASLSVSAEQVPTPLQGKDLTKAVFGNTLTVQIKPGVEALVFYAEDYKVLAKMPNGNLRTGSWRMKDSKHYCTLWDDAPDSEGCSFMIVKDESHHIFAEDGSPRGKVITIARGNALEESAKQ